MVSRSGAKHHKMPATNYLGEVLSFHSSTHFVLSELVENMRKPVLKKTH